MQVTSSSAPRIARDALGVGLRPPHYPYILEHAPEIGFFEVITENLLSRAEGPHRNVTAVRAKHPVVLHGVGLNLLGHEPLDRDYLDAVRRVADEVDAPWVTDHLCWTRDRGLSHHDLLPTPYVEDLVDLAAERAAFVQETLGRPFGLENLSSYVTFARSTMPEWTFFTEVVRRAGVHALLDVNNVYVSSLNHGFSPADYLDAVDFDRVLEVHLAGHTRLPDGTAIDTHDDHVCDEVWALYRDAWARGGPFPTLLEWDDRIPPFPEVLAEVSRAAAVRR